jgi:hypothetical protein
MSQIDQSQFEATEHPHVFLNKADSKFYFCDETSEAHGPYENLDHAKSNFDIYVDQNINPAENMSAGLKAMMGGDEGPLMGLLRQLSMAARPRISPGQREVQILQAMAAIKEEIELGQLTMTDRFPTVDSATIEMATRIMMSFAGHSDSLELLQQYVVDLTTGKGATEVIRHFFVERMFTLAPGGNGEYVSAVKELATPAPEMAREMAKGFWTMLKSKEAEGGVDIPAPQLDVTEKLADLAAHLVMEVRRRFNGYEGQIQPEDIVTAFVQNLQANVIIDHADDVTLLKLFLDQNMGASVEDVQEAMNMLPLLLLHYVRSIHNEDCAKDIKEQRWEWKDRGEAKIRELAEDAINRTVVELGSLN